MKRLTTLTGKNLPRLAVAKPGWPDNEPKRREGVVYVGTVPKGTILTHEIIADLMERRPREPFDIELKASGPSDKAVSDFTRVCDQTGLSEKLRKSDMEAGDADNLG